MTDLSPAAQAVMDAAVEHPVFATRKRIAAAFRVAASLASEYPGAGHFDSVGASWMRDQLLAIAGEMDPPQSPPTPAPPQP